MKHPFAETKNRPGKRLFWSVLVTYLLLLTVTLMVLAGGYSYSIRQARQDAESLEIAFLGQVRRELDIRLSSVSRVSSFLASYPLTQSVSEIREEEVSHQVSYRELDEIISEQNTLLEGEGETAVYFDASDSVLTGEYRYRSVNLDAYTRQLGFTPEEFRAFLSERKPQGELRILHPGTKDAELVYMVSVMDSSYRKVGTVLTRFSMAYLKRAANAEHWIDGSVCCMQSGEESLYIDSGGFGDAVSSSAPDYSAVPLDGAPVTMKIDGTPYLTVGLRSVESKWNYYFAIPLSAFTRSRVLYFVLFAVVLGLSVFSGVILSLYFSRRLADPIQKIMDALKLDSGGGYAKAVSSLQEAMLAYRKETSVARNWTQRSERQKKAGFVYGLCTGRIPPDRVDAGIERYGIRLNEGPISLIVFEYRTVAGSVFIQEGHLDQEMMLYAGCNVIEELLCQNGGVAIAHEKEVVCLCQPEDPEEEAMQGVLTEIGDFHRDVLHVGLHVFFTGSCKRLEDLPELLSVADEMDRYKEFWGDDVPDILFSSSISAMGGLESADMPSIEKRFMNLLAVENYEEAHRLLTEQLSGVSKDLRHFRQERYRIHGLISNLFESLSASVPKSSMEELEAVLNSLLAEQSLSGLREKVDVLFEKLIALQEEQDRAAGTPAWVQEVQTYIEAHYADPQLDVSHLAKVFSLNISHLSRTYKKFTSIGVLDSIHLTRIAKAKEMLDAGCTVQDASVKVGYQESRALIRAFKRYEGITPGQYQEIEQKNKAHGKE